MFSKNSSKTGKKCFYVPFIPNFFNNIGNMH